MIDFKNYDIPENTASSVSRLTLSNTFPHASMLVGGREEQALEIAYDISSALLCSGENPPCGVCKNCVKSERKAHPDVTVISPTNGRKSLTVDEARAMIADSFVLPNEADRKIYIITSAHTLSEQVQNALLKILEEPPAYDYFILLCLNPTAMLGTVRSRVTEFLLGEGEQVSDELFEKAREKSQALVSALLQVNEIELLRITADFEKDRKFTKQTMVCLKTIINDALKAKFGVGEDESGLAHRFTKEELIRLNGAADKIIGATDRNANEKLTITRISAELRRAIGG